MAGTGGGGVGWWFWSAAVVFGVGLSGWEFGRGFWWRLGGGEDGGGVGSLEGDFGGGWAEVRMVGEGLRGVGYSIPQLSLTGPTHNRGDSRSLSRGSLTPFRAQS